MLAFVLVLTRLAPQCHYDPSRRTRMKQKRRRKKRRRKRTKKRKKGKRKRR